MNKQMKRLGGLLLALAPAAAHAQAPAETELVQQRDKAGQLEEFRVLTSDKATRHGSYVRYRMMERLAGITVYEAGTYDHGQKQGEWRSFAENRARNRLVSRGTYRAGIAEGPWTYYHYSAAPAPPRTLLLGQSPATGSYGVATDDTTAVVQAKGFCVAGERAGLWKYYDAHSGLVQAVNHSATPAQLLYWRPAAGPAVSGAAALANHPVLYMGGKEQLQHDILNVFDPKFLAEYGNGATIGVAFQIDGNGQQTSVELTTKAPPTRYEQLVLTQLRKIPARWLPRVVDGQAQAAGYYVLLTSTVEGNTRLLTAEPLGN
jgi:hypothetical protein